MRLKINLQKLLNEAEFESDLVPYFAKLFLRDLGVPVIIDPRNVKDPDLNVSTGRISHEYVVSDEEFVMVIDYFKGD